MRRTKWDMPKQTHCDLSKYQWWMQIYADLRKYKAQRLVQSLPMTQGSTSTKLNKILNKEPFSSTWGTGSLDLPILDSWTSINVPQYRFSELWREAGSNLNICVSPYSTCNSILHLELSAIWQLKVKGLYSPYKAVLQKILYSSCPCYVSTWHFYLIKLHKLFCCQKSWDWQTQRMDSKWQYKMLIKANIKQFLFISSEEHNWKQLCFKGDSNRLYCYLFAMLSTSIYV